MTNGARGRVVLSHPGEEIVALLVAVASGHSLKSDERSAIRDFARTLQQSATCHMNDEALAVLDRMIAECDERERKIRPMRGPKDLRPMGSDLGVKIRRALLQEVRDELSRAAA